jgi:hypothetical protein
VAGRTARAARRRGSPPAPADRADFGRSRRALPDEGRLDGDALDRRVGDCRQGEQGPLRGLLSAPGAAALRRLRPARSGRFDAVVQQRAAAGERVVQ